MSFSFAGLWNKVKVKVLIALVTLILESIRAAYPSVPLPPTELVVGIAAALAATHTLTDVVNILREALVAWAQAKNGGGR